MTKIAVLPDAATLAITGEDRVAFSARPRLKRRGRGRAGPRRMGRVADAARKMAGGFFVLTDGERLLLDCEREQSAMLVQRLSRYRLRSRVR